MTKTDNKGKKFKTAGLITFVVVGLSVIGLVYNKRSNSYELEFKKESSSFTSVKQLEAAIKESDLALARLQKVIDSDETNPEERYEARHMYESIGKERAKWVAQLNKLKAKAGKTIHLYDVNNSR